MTGLRTLPKLLPFCALILHLTQGSSKSSCSQYRKNTNSYWSMSESSTCFKAVSSTDTASQKNECGEEISQPRAVDGFTPGPYIRSPLARAMYYKLKEDECNKNDRHVYWYRVIVSRLSSHLQSKFIQFDQDEGTDEFLEKCKDKSDWFFSQLFYSLAKPILNLFMTQTSINGFLNRGSMFVFSKAQIEKLLNISSYSKEDNLLDLGAGDGMVTLQMSTYFRNTYVTEMSTPMIRRLHAHGFKVLGVDNWQTSGMKFNLISCLNLLDRCDKPLTLLADVKTVLAPVSGRLLVAVVIPFKPYVEFESKMHEPSEYIHIKGINFEEEVESFARVFHQAGFEVERWSRLPYLCEGDMRHSYYNLSDAVFVLKMIPSVS